MIGRDRTGKIRRDSKTFGKEHDAIAHKVSVEAYASGAGADSLQARAAQWIEDRHAMGKITEKTVVGYRQKIAGWAALIGPKPYKKITTADIDSAFAKLAKGQTPTGRVPSARTLHHYRTVLATFYMAMVKKREILHSPVLGDRRKRLGQVGHGAVGDGTCRLAPRGNHRRRGAVGWTGLDRRTL